jgi:hypothetical protein
MREAYAGAGNTPNSRGAGIRTGFPRSRTISPLQAAISSLLRDKNPRKTWGFLADAFGLRERQCKARLSGETCYTIEELQALLQSEDGLDFLVAVMADATPTWWKWALKVMAIASVRRRQDADQQLLMSLERGAAEQSARRRIQGALNADRQVSEALKRAETALGFQEPDEDRAVVVGRRPGARLPHRPVAAKGGRR